MREKIVQDEDDNSFKDTNDDNTRDDNITEIDIEDDSDEVSDTTESVIITSLVEQADFYEGRESEPRKKDTEKTIQTYIKKIYRQVKFLTDSGKNYKEPNFVQHVHEQKSQAAQLCEYFWKSLG